ncbi:MAG: TIGR03936 family radical SAM-associated protein [Alkalispirochaeta sp.]
MTRKIVPTTDLREILNRVENPGRYVGGEWGSITKNDGSVVLKIALTFPELYEIGMSNTAIKILYGMLNAIPEVACERVFVPAPDFEGELEVHGVPLYTLETGTPVGETDLLAVSFGYELLATNVLTILKTAGIPLHAVDRREQDPIVVLGGPGATNPAPMAPFVDGVFIGEAEAALSDLVREMIVLKRRGGSRDDAIEVLRRHPSVWTGADESRVRRAIWTGFGDEGVSRAARVFPVPSIPVVQDHGVVEIMRGCPQGCRFCHAGSYYRPYRMKTIETILEEVRFLVEQMGYREISLSSLSTGDYHDIVGLVRELTRNFARRGVSFSLPSLRVNSVTLPIFEAISGGKRSGITFAVESADTEAQRGINKMVPLERVIEIAREARARGWQHAKLYFMIGLPVQGTDEEAAAIVRYVTELRRHARMEYVVNVGTFVPKPHTPFQWDRQITPEEGKRTLEEIRNALPRGTRLRGHDPYNSWLEGVITRGDTVISEMIEEAFLRGARLDAWNEYANIPLWRELAADERYRDAVERGFGPFPLDAPLPWDSVSLGVSRSFLKQERARAAEGTLTERCRPNCEIPCGVCNRYVLVRDRAAGDTPRDEPPTPTIPVIEVEGGEDQRKRDQNHGREYQLVVGYRKEGSAAFLPHLALVRTFERAWHRIGLPFALSQGYHPKPKMSFGQPLPLGAASEDELVIVNVQNIIQLETYYHMLDAALPAGFSVFGMLLLHHEKGSSRIPSPMQQYAGSRYRIHRSTNWVSVDAGVSSGEMPPWSTVIDTLTRHGAAGTAGRNGDEEYTFFLSGDASGIGKIKKELPGADRLVIERLGMYADRAGEVRLYDYYRRHPGCVAVTGYGEPADASSVR